MPGAFENNKEANVAETQKARGRIKRNKVRGLAREQNTQDPWVCGFYLDFI